MSGHPQNPRDAGRLRPTEGVALVVVVVCILIGLYLLWAPGR